MSPRGWTLLLLLLELEAEMAEVCPLQDLASAVEAATLVVTGKVEAVVAGASAVSVRVKRVVRGRAASVVTLATPPLCRGGGARLGQTAIFLAAADLRLLVPPVALTLDNLNTLAGAVELATWVALPFVCVGVSEGVGNIVRRCDACATSQLSSVSLWTSTRTHVESDDGVAMMVRWRRGRGAAVALLSLAVVGAVSALTAVFLTYSSRKPANLLSRDGCPSSCPSLLAPVCGTDDVTYRNLCQLQKKACVHRDRTRMAHQGPCGDVETYGDKAVGGEGEEDPCEILRCPVTSRCVVRGEGSLAAACECEAGPCPQEAATFPVCGSDGRTYDSECELRQAACRTRGDGLRLRLRGPCDPCGETTCPWPSVCRLDAERRPRCVCGETCPPEKMAPVCASDGNTYAGECVLRLHGCRLQAAPLRILYRGPCSSGRNPCDGLRCERRLGECFVDDAGVAHCRCPDDACEDVYRPVCGSDGQTYASDCHLRRDACLLNHNLTLRHHGVCGDSCRRVECDFHGVCKVDSKGQAVCSCDLPCLQEASLRFQMASASSAVCGSDGKTHPSLCQLQRASCLGRKDVAVVHRGPCRDDPCRDVSCDLRATCEVSPEDGLPRCVCRFRCGVHQRSLPVCGSDNRSYLSLCHLHAEACRKRKHQLKPLGNDAPLCTDPGKRSRCQSSAFGCCEDGKSPAKGPGAEGCSRKCFCNRLGSWKGKCDPEAGDDDDDVPRCVCRKGVVGVRCDRCDAGFWGLSLSGRRGCQPCQCSPLGSVRRDCDQMTGRCSCLPGVQGRRCQRCSGPDEVLGPSGCATSSGDAGGTDRPSTLEQEDGLPQSKSTRHLHLQRYHLVHRPGHEELATPHPRPSPAAVGDACSYDAQCAAAVTLSVCVDGVCRCRGGLVASGDGRVCREYNSAGFDGDAFMRLPCLKAYQKLRLDLELVSFSGEGVVLYNQHKEDGSGDFVALALVNGHVQFRYNLGNGVVALTSREKVTLGRRHRVSARRYHRDGALRLDDGDDVTGQSQGFLKALDLHQDLFLGNLPPGATQKVAENAGTSAGLVGCVLSLQVGQQPLPLHHGASQVLEARGVRDCDCGRGDACNAPSAPPCERPDCDRDQGRRRADPCGTEDPCVAGAECSSLAGGGGFQCTRTRRGPGGPTSMARFSGSSTTELPRLEGVTRALALDVRFLTSRPDGVLLFSGQRRGGDFVALLLLQGQLHFRFDLGSGPALLRSPEAVELGRWHRVRASRVDRGGTLQLDEGRLVHGSSAPPLEELNVDSPLYVGGIPRDLRTPLGSTPLVGLVGAVQSLVVNGRRMEDLLAPCNGTWCRAAPESGAAVRFDDKSSLRLPLRTLESSNASWEVAGVAEGEEPDHGGPAATRWRTVAMTLRTSDDEAQLLRVSGDVRVVLVSGFVQLSVGDGGSVRTKMAVNDGQWHSLSLERRPRRLQLHVDASTVSLATSSSTRRHSLWLGGAGFGGCIGKVVLGRGGVVDVAALASRQWGKPAQLCHDNDVQ